MNQREHEADREAGKADGRALVSRAENHDQEHERHHDFGQQRRRQRILTRRVLAVAVRRKPSGQTEISFAAGYDEQHSRGRYCTRDLRHDVRQQMPCRKPAARPQPDRHGRIEMPTGDRSQRIGAGQHSQAERERNARQPDTHVRKGGRQYGTAATTENQPERPEELRRQLGEHGAPLLARLLLDVCRKRARRILVFM